MTLKWGILGTGSIAATFAEALTLAGASEAIAVGSRTLAGAERFGDRFGIPRRYEGYDALLGDPDVQVVYIATPHTLHAPWAIRCAELGKHVLCEKPLTVGLDDAKRVIAAARDHDVFLMEAFMYRCHPQTAKLVALLRAGLIGEVRMLQASFGFAGEPEAGHCLFDRRFGGGAILDVGCYPISMARLIAGVASGEPFAEPVRLDAWGRIGRDTQVDEVATANLVFPGGVCAQVATAITLELDNEVRVFGTKGSLTVPSPWFCGTDRGGAKLLHRREASDEPEVIDVDGDDHLYLAEIEAVEAHLASRQAPAMSWQDTLGNMSVLDGWLEAVGMRYGDEA